MTTDLSKAERRFLYFKAEGFLVKDKESWKGKRKIHRANRDLRFFWVQLSGGNDR